MPQPTRKGRPLERDRAEIVQTARTVAAERGFDGLRFSDVSKATNVPVSTLQYAFGTRDALVRDVLRAGVRDELERLTIAVEAESDPWRMIDRFIRLSISVDGHDRREGWLLWIEYWRAALRDPELRLDYADVARAWRRLVKRAVEQGVAQGRFSIDGSSDDTAAAIVGIVDGLGIQVEVGDARMPASRALPIAQRAVVRILGMTT